MATVSKTNTEADYFSDENAEPSMDNLLQPIDSNLFKIEEELKLFEPARPANASLNGKRKSSVVLETNSYSNPTSSPAAKQMYNLNKESSSPVRDAVPSVLINKKPIDQSAMSLALEITRRGRGRPKGSKNKTKEEKIVKEVKISKKNVKYEKSSFTWSNLLTLCLMNAPKEIATVNTLYDFIGYNFPNNVLRTDKNEAWKSTIRQTLTEKNRFMKKEGSSNSTTVFWIMNPDRREELIADCIAKANEFKDDLDSLKMKHPEKLQEMLNGEVGIPSNLDFYEFNGNTFKVKENIREQFPIESEPPSYEQFSRSLPLTYSNPASPPLQDKFATFSQNQYQTQPNQWNYVNSQQEYRTLMVCGIPPESLSNLAIFKNAIPHITEFFFEPARPANASLNMKIDNSVVLETNSYSNPTSSPAAKQMYNLNKESSSPVRDAVPSVLMNKKPIDQSAMSLALEITRRGRGRPKGSKNKTKEEKIVKEVKISKKNVKYEKSSFTWSNLITLCLMNAPKEIATVNTLYDFIGYNFPNNVLRTDKNEAWKSTIRQTLTEKNRFMKKEGSSNSTTVFWIMNPDRREELIADCIAKANEFKDDLDSLKMKHPEKLQEMLNGEVGIPSNLDFYEFNGNTFKVKENIREQFPLESEPPSYEQFSRSLPLTYSNPASPPLQDKFATFSQNQYQTQPNQWNYVNSQQEYRTLSENYNIYGNNSEDQFCLTLL